MFAERDATVQRPQPPVRREDIAEAWDFPSIPGTKAVANSDEDSLTMAVEAGADCLKGIDEKTVDGVFFASTTSPFVEKTASSIIAKALDMREDILTMDVTNSLRYFERSLFSSNSSASHSNLPARCIMTG
ncbi:MAG: hypothetical protein GYA24_04415 [Candidatus Lokiarchaeota archaeon]|nr:hypothetical protein [Candidatus Lokiarchaeota archaeon]